jgi:hypothetical protein
MPQAYYKIRQIISISGETIPGGGLSEVVQAKRADAWRTVEESLVLLSRHFANLYFIRYTIKGAGWPKTNGGKKSR